MPAKGEATPLVKQKHGGALKPGRGRTPGVKNKVTNDIREMVMKATELAAKDLTKRKSATAVDYLRIQAKDNPVAFLGLLKRMIPAKLDVELALTGEDLASILQARRQALAEQRMKTVDDADVVEE